jgi:hypothetical protein
VAPRGRLRRLVALRPLPGRAPRRGVPDADARRAVRGGGAAAGLPAVQGVRAPARRRHGRRALRRVPRVLVWRRPEEREASGQDALLRRRRHGQLLRAPHRGRHHGGGPRRDGHREVQGQGHVPRAQGRGHGLPRRQGRPPLAGPEPAPGVVVQPKGRGFHIDGHVVRYAIGQLSLITTRFFFHPQVARSPRESMSKERINAFEYMQNDIDVQLRSSLRKEKKSETVLF